MVVKSKSPMKDTVILHARDIGKTLHIVAGRPFTWLYLGQDIAQRENISQVLGKDSRYIIGNSLQKVAYQQKEAFLTFIAELGLCQKSKRHWWASNTAYKNPLVSDFFLLWCYDALFEKVCAERKDNEEGMLLVFVENRWFYRYLWQYHNKGKNEAGISFPSRKSILPEILKSVTGGIADRGYFLLKAIYHIWQTRRITSRHTTNSGEEHRTQIYLFSWIDDSFFRDNGEFNDVYFGRLPQILAKNGLNVTYIAPPFLPAALKRKCLDCSKYEFTFLDQYINFGNVLKCLFMLFRIYYDSKQRWLRILLWYQAVYEISSVPQNILYYFAFKRWMKEISQHDITIIYPFENQPWEKMLCTVAREAGKNTKLVGYQHTTVPLLLLNYFPGAGESSTMPLPHLIVANGEYTLNLLKDAQYGDVELINGGALRHEYLYKAGKDLAKQKKKSETVLVALPYLRSLSEEILVAIFNAFKDLDEETIRFVMKFHPDVPLEHLRIQLPSWPLHFQKTDESMSDILRDVDSVIYASSTVGLEAMLGGIPTIRYCSEHTLELDSLDIVDRRVVSCSGDNMKQVVLTVLKEGISHTAQESTSEVSNLNRFFSPVDEDVWRQIADSVHNGQETRGEFRNLEG